LAAVHFERAAGRPELEHKSVGVLSDELVTKPSGNSYFDQALVLAVERTKLPAPPPELRKLARNDGLELNFRP